MQNRTGPVKFPVLVNGKRDELAAFHAQGWDGLGAARRPFDMIVLDQSCC